MAVGARQTVRICASRFPGFVCSILAIIILAQLAGSRELQAAEEAKTKAVENAPDGAKLITWTADEVAAAEEQCKRLAHLVGIKYSPQPPMRQGHCGDAAPVKLIGVGSRSILLTPPVVANCRIAEAVHTWIDTVVQPAALALLGQGVVRLVGVSSYVCRNRNGAPVGPISEHAYANAFDVTSFALSDGRVISVKEWIPTTTNAGLPDGTPKASPSGTTGTPIAGPPNKDEKAEARVAFLKRIHHEACRIFGTVLGPEANAAHLEHLHLDMKARKGRGYCQ